MNKTLHSLELSISFNFRAGKPDFARSLAFASKFGTSLQERENSEMGYCWFSHDVTKLQTSELLILLRCYFHDE